MKVTFVMPDGIECAVEARPGFTVMEIAVENGMPGIMADCGGACACATCHVHVADDWAERLPERQSMEADMLEFAEGVDDRSRLGCQIKLSEELDGLRVSIPHESL